MTLFDFEKCISRKSPTKDTQDFLVIYKNTPSVLIIDAYLKSAQILIDKILETRISATDDLFSLPLLNIYSNTLEFSLKYFIKKMDKHREKKYCKCIKPLSHKQKNSLTSEHDLIKLVDIINKIMPNKDQIHYLQDFKAIDRFITSFTNFGIRSDSTRYVTNRKGEPYDLHNDQVWIYPKVLHSSIYFIIKKLLFAVQCDEFNYCDVNEFSAERRNELNKGIKLMREVGSIFSTYNRNVSHTNANVSAKDLSQIFNQDMANLQALTSDLIRIEKRELALLCMCLYFTQHPMYIENLDYFLQYNEEKLIQTIKERAHLFDDSLTRIEFHLNYLEDNKNRRNIID